MHVLRLSGAAVVCFLLVLESGCSRTSSGRAKPVAAAGSLAWEDGKPVAEASVVFVPDDPKGQSAAGLTGKDGSFTLTTFNQDDGAVPGDYKIVVTKGAFKVGEPTKESNPAKLMKEWLEKSKEEKKSEVPGIYGNPKTTPLKWRIEAGGEKIQLKLKIL
jgi:hypothetical protein